MDQHRRSPAEDPVGQGQGSRVGGREPPGQATARRHHRLDDHLAGVPVQRGDHFGGGRAHHGGDDGHPVGLQIEQIPLVQVPGDDRGRVVDGSECAESIEPRAERVEGIEVVPRGPDDDQVVGGPVHGWIGPDPVFEHDPHRGTGPLVERSVGVVAADVFRGSRGERHLRTHDRIPPVATHRVDRVGLNCGGVGVRAAGVRPSSGHSPRRSIVPVRHPGGCPGGRSRDNGRRSAPGSSSPGLSRAGMAGRDESHGNGGCGPAGTGHDGSIWPLPCHWSRGYS